MATKPTNQGWPHLSDIATQDALPYVGSASREDGQTVLNTVSADLAKFSEDRNILLVDGGTMTYSTGSLNLTATFKLHINSRIGTGGTLPPVSITITGTSFAFTATGKMLYAVIDRVAGTATIFADASELPTVKAANKEVVLIAKRLDAATERLYLRNGQSIGTGESTVLGAAAVNPSFDDSIFEVYDNTTPTKKMKWQVSGLTGTNTFTPPPATDTLAGLGTAQTFTATQTHSADIVPSSTNAYSLGSGNVVWQNTYSSVLIAGRGDGTGSVGSGTLRGPARTGTDAAGADVTFDAANGTGTGGSGKLIFRTAPSAASSSTANTLANIAQADKNGAWVFGTTSSSGPLFGHSVSINAGTGLSSPGRALAIAFSSSNSPVVLGVAQSNGFPYLAFNAVQTAGSDNQTFAITGNPSMRMFPSGSPVEIQVSASGTAGNTIGWTTAAIASTVGAWTLGPSDSSSITHTIRGNSVNSTLNVRANGLSGQIRLERTTSSAGTCDIGADSSGFSVRNDNGNGKVHLQIAINANTTLAASTNSGVFINGTSGQSNSWANHQAGDNNQQTFQEFFTASTNFGNGTGRGILRKKSAVNEVEFAAFSDRRLKTNITTADLEQEAFLAKLMEVRLVRYDLKDSSCPPGALGVIAQELHEVFPDKIGVTDAGTGENMPEGVAPWNVGSSWHYELIGAIQQLKAEFDAYVLAHP